MGSAIVIVLAVLFFLVSLWLEDKALHSSRLVIALIGIGFFVYRIVFVESGWAAVGLIVIFAVAGVKAIVDLRKKASAIT